MIETSAALGVITIKSSARAPEVVRKWVAHMFQEVSLGDDYVARTVVTELVTNVYAHTNTERVSVRLLLENGCPVLEVEDESDKVPVVRDWDGEAESGRGLLMMSMLVEEWGARALADGGKVTWARLSG